MCVVWPSNGFQLNTWPSYLKSHDCGSTVGDDCCWQAACGLQRTGMGPPAAGCRCSWLLKISPKRSSSYWEGIQQVMQRFDLNFEWAWPMEISCCASRKTGHIAANFCALLVCNVWVGQLPRVLSDE